MSITTIFLLQQHTEELLQQAFFLVVKRKRIITDIAVGKLVSQQILELHLEILN